MKPYFKVLYNYLRISIKKISNRNIQSGCIQMFSYSSKLNFKKKSHVYLGNKIVSDGCIDIYADKNSILHIGKSVYFNKGLIISCKENVHIGNNCLFGPDVKIYDNNHKFDSKNGVSFNHSTGSVYIGNNCWIASNVVILKGANIGDNCVIGAGCIIDSIIPSGSIVKQENNLVIRAM